MATRPSASSSARLLAAVRDVCSSTVDGRELRARVIDLISREMPVDAYAFVLTDPETSVGIDPFASIPDLDELPLVITLKYATPAHRWTSLGDVVSLASLPVAARGPWHEYVLAHGILDVASMVLRDRYGCWGFIDLWSTRSLYAECDLALLRDLEAVLTAAMRRCQGSTFAASASGGAVRDDTAEESAAVVLLDTSPERGLVITGSTSGAWVWLSRLLPRGSGPAPVPAAVLNVAAQLLACEAGIDDSPALGRIHVGSGVWLRLRASRIAPSGQVAVTIECATPADRVEVFARAHGLSPRERELLDVLVTGLDTADAAAHLFISPNTVQDHLKSVFTKAGVHSRRELMGRLLCVTPTHR